MLASRALRAPGQHTYTWRSPGRQKRLLRSLRMTDLLSGARGMDYNAFSPA